MTSENKDVEEMKEFIEDKNKESYSHSSENGKAAEIKIQ
ncbi:hypothetical protein TNCT_212591, partial [Trichonephila clavata]